MKLLTFYSFTKAYETEFCISIKKYSTVVPPTQQYYTKIVFHLLIICQLHKSINLNMVNIIISKNHGFIKK